jgi:hypothetical protein
VSAYVARSKVRFSSLRTAARQLLSAATLN